jgi:L-lactate dehydrogenase complex protein LldG
MSFDTGRARDDILQRIRAAQGRGRPGAEDQASAVDYLTRHPAGPSPSHYGDRVAQFCAMAERMASTVETVASAAQAPEAVARYLAALGIAPKIVAWPALRELSWSGAGVAAEYRAPRRDESAGTDLVGITGAFCAIAETGTLVLLSGLDTPASTHLLPETHIALLPEDRIVATMEDAFELLRSEAGGAARMMPRSINMVSGPSRTGDIEQTIVLGAHGPYRVHIIITKAA